MKTEESLTRKAESKHIFISYLSLCEAAALPSNVECGLEKFKYEQLSLAQQLSVLDIICFWFDYLFVTFV